jgi:hypothetical protein
MILKDPVSEVLGFVSVSERHFSAGMPNETNRSLVKSRNDWRRAPPDPCLGSVGGANKGCGGTAGILVVVDVFRSETPAVFGHNLQCELIGKVDTRDE